jgi:hypothetical protein
MFKLCSPFSPVIYELYLEYQPKINKDGVEKNEVMRELYWIQRQLFDPL